MSNKNICNNCGKHGHHLHQCKHPITSYGVILFTDDKDLLDNDCKYKLLMIQRKNTYGFIDFMRGKYSISNQIHIQELFNEMTNDEKNLIMNNSFKTLWKYMWKDTVSLYTNKNEEITSETKFNLLKSGIIHKNKLINVEYLCENSTTSWTSQEWDFPKGRKNTDENDINCAIREFEEETGIKKELLNLSGNTLTLEEGFIGTNNKSYKNKYYIAHVKNAKNISLEKYQESEVSYVGWKDINELMSNIRDYQHEKKNIIINIDSILKNYTFYM